MPLPVLYPKALTTIRNAIELTGVTNKELQHKTRKSLTAISQYRNGQSRPDSTGNRKPEGTHGISATVDSMADLFAQRASEIGKAFNKEEFIKNLTDGWATAVVPTEDGLKTEGGSGHYDEVRDGTLAELANRQRTLKVTCSTFKPFSGEDTLFFNRLFGRFLAVAGLGHPKLIPENGLQDHNHADSDLVLGLFDSTDRMLRMNLKFWRFPIRISLGAICSERHAYAVSNLAVLLSKPRSEITDPSVLNERIRPIVVKGEVGHLHCLHRLEMPEDDIDDGLDTLDIEELGSRLMKASAEQNVTSIPVICVDEFSAMEVLRSLGTKGMSVFRLNSDEASRKDDSRVELPQFYCSAAIKRDAPDKFAEFLRDGLSQFLSTEVETTAKLIATLADALAKRLEPIAIAAGGTGDWRSKVSSSADSVMQWSRSPAAEAHKWSLTWSWIFYTLHLTGALIKSYSDTTLPWRPILRRAREIVHSNIVKNHRPMLVSLVDLYFASQRPEKTAHQTEPTEEQFRELSRQITRLCDLLDIDLDPQARNSKRYIDEPTALVGTIERALLGQPPDHQIEVRVYDPSLEGNAEHVRDMKTILRRLQDMYERLPINHDLRPENAGREAVKTLEEDIEQLASKESDYGAENGRIIIARLRGDRKPLGGVCINLKEKQCQYRYLWVDPSTRGLRIGARMIDEALAFARQEHCENAFVEVLPDAQLRTATKLFIDKGFTFANKKRNGRVVLVRKIEA